MDINQNSNKTLKKGKLRIFFGMASGVGKTYEMLEAANVLKSEGRDIVIGYIETHNRFAIEDIAENLEKIKYKAFHDTNTTFFEPDIDIIISRNPEIVIIDDLSHSNTLGSRHKKRYQDILELLNYGINVWTTLNVQNIESRATIVEQITGIEVKETVPDFVVEMAEKIEIIDINPKDLKKRLKEGKIYPINEITPSITNFFREGNINALREISLQVVAKLVDKNIVDYRTEHNISKLWKASEKLLVAVGPSPYSEYLIKWTKKTAFNMKAQWIAVNIENSISLNKEQKKMLNNNIELARQLGAKIITITDDDIVNGIIRTAKEYNASQIVVGKPTLFNIKNIFKENITDRLIKESGDIDVYVVTQPGIKEKKSLFFDKMSFNISNREKFIVAISFILVSLIGYFSQNYISYWGASLIYLLYIITISSFYSRTSSILVSILSAIVWNYAFIPPKFTFFITNPEDILTYITFLVIALVTGNLTSKLHLKEEFLKKREKNLELLYELSQEIVKNTEFDETMLKAIEYLEKYFESETLIFLQEQEIYPNSTFSEKNQEIATWVLRNSIPAGKGTNSFSESDYYFYPIKSTLKCEGVIILKVNSKKISEHIEFLKTVSFMLSSAIIKDSVVKMNQKLMVEEETEKLYSIILRSISHELKTPVTTISLSVNGLKDEVLMINENTREILINDISEANNRLDRIITNLLDMTRIESGRLKLNLQWNDINDLIVASIYKYKKELNAFKFSKNILNVIPPVKFDFGLIEQVISNLLFNAIIHTKANSEIIITAGTVEENIFIEIADNGGGIKSIDKIFNKFYKEHPKKTGGLGIGLSICKAIIDFHKWKLEAFNNDIGGATFRITIPFIKEWNE